MPDLVAEIDDLTMGYEEAAWVIPRGCVGDTPSPGVGDTPSLGALKAGRRLGVVEAVCLGLG